MNPWNKGNISTPLNQFPRSYFRSIPLLTQPHFIREYKLPTDDLLIKDLNGYRNFNDFFARKLVPDARVPQDPHDPSRIVSPADCRCVAFPVDEVTKFWIKVICFLQKLTEGR
jgi:phosphatidylserine decarboxylase